MGDIPGFSGFCNLDLPATEHETSGKKCGTFQSMGLSSEVLKALWLKGYRIPTPIQRKTIPLLLEGRDVVGMAKTGSGKTACFLIPLFEKFKRISLVGPRALILSPTRELAIQTYKFCKEIGKFSDLKVILVLGGDSMDSQFSALHESPDVIIATPGRFLHISVEMDLSLSSIEYVVFDEADQLFDMGFGEQLKQILGRLPGERQTVMFSATMPKLLIDFVEAGLRNPVLTRLDVESKIPESLDLQFVYCRPVERYAVLLVLLKYVISKESHVIVFAATQHHVELISALLTHFNISNTCIYSNLDASARKINAAKFATRKVSVLIVTDIAARGIDIPNLDYVINFHFPGKSKLFVHRVGRCARAGNSGTAYTIFSTEDVAHVLDLHLFLNRNFELENRKSIGKFSQDVIEDEYCMAINYMKTQMMNLYNVSENAYKKYISSRSVASVESNKKVKTISFAALTPFERFFDSKVQQGEIVIIANEDQAGAKDEKTHDSIFSQIKNYRPSGTIFELNPHKKSVPLEIMKRKRAFQSAIINNRCNEIDIHFKRGKQSAQTGIFASECKNLKENNAESLNTKHKNRRNSLRNPDHYIPYESRDKHTEEGLSLQSFVRQARNLEMSLVDKNQEIAFRPGMKKWDRIKKKMVSVSNPFAGKIQNESGLWIPATYKTGRYSDWKKKTKVQSLLNRDNADNFPANITQSYPIHRHRRHNIKMKKNKLTLNELKLPEQIAKKRLRVENAKQRELQNKIKKQERKRKVKK